MELVLPYYLIYSTSHRLMEINAQPEQAKGGKPKKDEPKKEEPKKEAKKEDDMDDLFGDDDGEDNKAALEELQKKKDAEKKDKKKKEAVIAKSLILLDIKVWEEEQNLDELANKVITNIVKDGLFWKTEYVLKDVAFGMKKIHIGCVVEDEKVSIDDVIDEIQAWEDEVQSVDIVAFNKI